MNQARQSEAQVCGCGQAECKSANKWASLVSLHDGRQVCSYSEEWRHECEARGILKLPNRSKRQLFLYGWKDPSTGRWTQGVLQRRGEAAVKRLEETIMAIWRAEKAANDNAN